MDSGSVVADLKRLISAEGRSLLQSHNLLRPLVEQMVTSVAIADVAVTEEETYLRTNFDKGDNRGFRDGDPGSSRFFNRFSEEDGDTQNMYDSPKHKVERNEDGEIVRQYDESNYRTSLINNEVRVYKGGSWRDRAYWLDPAQRRYLPQYMATDDIGFRCAMSRVGSKSRSKKTL